MKREYIYIKSLGCLSSIHLTERLIKYFQINNYDIVSYGDANVLILSCCIVTEDEEQHIVEILRANTDKKVYLVGCINHQIAERLEKYHNNIIAVCGYHDIELYFPPVKYKLTDVGFVGNYPMTKVPFYIEDKYHDYGVFINVINRLSENAGEQVCNSIIGYEFRSKATKYFKVLVSEGCTHQCAFCLVRKVKGAYRSRTLEAILADIEVGYELGFKNFVLVSDEMSAYGIDLYKKYALGDLLKKITDSFDDIKLQLRYLEPMHLKAIWKDIKPLITDQWISYLNIPIQSGSEQLLTRLKRKTDLGYLTSVLDEIRQAYSGPLLTHTIVGFEFESEEDIKDTTKYLEKFDNTSVHMFSPRKGTELEAVKLHKDIKNHVELLEKAQRQIRTKSLKKIVNSISNKNPEKVEKELEYRYPVEVLSKEAIDFLDSLKWGEVIHQADIIFMNPQISGFVARIRVSCGFFLQFKIKQSDNMWNEVSIPVERDEIKSIIHVLHDYFVPMGIVEKWRKSKRLETGVSVYLDDVTHLGEYLEVEGINVDVETIMNTLALNPEESYPPYGRSLDSLELDIESEIHEFLVRL